MNDSLVFRNGLIFSLSLCAIVLVGAIWHRFWFRHRIAQSIGNRSILSDEEIINSQTFAVTDRPALILIFSALGEFYSIEYGKLRNSDRFDVELLPPISAFWFGIRNRAGNHIAVRLLQRYPKIDFSNGVPEDNIITVAHLVKHFYAFVPNKK